MGDTGSQFLGIFLAIVGILFFWNLPPGNLEFGKVIEAKFQYSLLAISKNIIIVILAFIIPLVDTSTVFINRISKGSSPFIGGKDHTTHHLSYLGLSEKKIAGLFFLICLVSLFMIYSILNYIPVWNFIYLILFSVYALSVFFILFYITKTSSQENLQKGNKTILETSNNELN